MRRPWLGPILMLAGFQAWGQDAPLAFLNHNHPLLDAHNCYPYKGQFADRIARALSTGLPVAIEQDLALSADGRVVVSHTTKVTGEEPTLEQHFFERVRPIVEKALQENDRSRWPVIVLHFDFKSNEIPLVEAVWKVLGKYPDWITTAVKTADAHQLSPFEARPLLVLTEESDAQEEVFFQKVAVGERLRIFGSAHIASNPGKNTAEQHHFLASTPPAQLLEEKPTNYRRWWNNSWYPVEEAGQPKAGRWTKRSETRLRALVDHAHHLGYWIRFYTLDGFGAGDDRGWGDSYNFGSKNGVEARWRAAIKAGVDLIATDQYEDLAAFMKK